MWETIGWSALLLVLLALMVFEAIGQYYITQIAFSGFVADDWKGKAFQTAAVMYWVRMGVALIWTVSTVAIAIALYRRGIKS